MNPLDNPRQRWLESLEDGEPCDHPGCLAHVTKPCEGCGRTGGKRHPNEKYRLASKRLIQKALSTGDVQMLHDIHILMDAVSELYNSMADMR